MNNKEEILTITRFIDGIYKDHYPTLLDDNNNLKEKYRNKLKKLHKGRN